jgi:hypothetical protein
MKISFDKFKKKQFSEEKLFCLVSGIRGAGKSTVIGTLGVPTLLIASSLESHAINAARVFGKDNIIPTLYDVDDNEKQLRPDAALQNLHDILDFLISSEDLLDNIGAVVLDSISAVDKTLLETTRILQEKNGFESMKIMEQEHFRIIKKLKELHRRGLHVVATMPILGAFDEEGFYISAKPEIRGVTATSNIAGIFGEILVCAKIGDEHFFQMNLLIKKTGKEVSGDKKEIAFHPRITGLTDEDIVEIGGPNRVIPANLSYVYELKKVKLQQPTK